MTETISIKKVYDELKLMRNDILFIKKHINDPDTIMTEEESKRFEESIAELKQGKTVSLDKLKKELGL